MTEREQAISDLINSMKANDETAGAVAGIKLLGFVMEDLHMIAVSVASSSVKKKPAARKRR